MGALDAAIVGSRVMQRSCPKILRHLRCNPNFRSSFDEEDGPRPALRSTQDDMSICYFFLIKKKNSFSNFIFSRRKNKISLPINGKRQKVKNKSTTEGKLWEVKFSTILHLLTLFLSYYYMWNRISSFYFDSPQNK